MIKQPVCGMRSRWMSWMAAEDMGESVEKERLEAWLRRDLG